MVASKRKKEVQYLEKKENIKKLLESLGYENILRYMVEDLDKIKAPLLTEPAVLENAGYDGRRSACCIGSAGELIELIEI